ncbi:gastricsin-like isoform X1 [Mucor ambiguus]|uniref:rhizopuspepsin n=1 Tax=Mucor ambiguus TaxID=91626 RepID=A0A0C9MCS4_9FUNG|nr:gastricsin-like isoform X1 [Mucor ambiguus]
MKLASYFIYTAIVLVLNSQAAEATDSPQTLLRLPIKRREDIAATTRQHNKFGKRANNDISLYNANGKEYLIEIGIGTPPQFFNVTLDTGSADCWVPAQTCPTSMCPHTRFDNQKSTSFKPLSQQLAISYGVGSAKGTYATETLTLGSAGGVALSNFTVGLVSNTNNILMASMAEDGDSAPSNGIFGLGYPNLSMKSGEKPGHFVMGLYQAKTINEPIFSIFLNSQSAYGNTGEMLLGGIDNNKFTGQMQYAPVISYDVSTYVISPNLGSNITSKVANSQESHLYWAVPGQGVETSSGYKQNSKTLQGYILDTGTTLTYVPSSVAKSIVMSVTQNAKTTQLDAINGVYRVSCSTAKQTGNVSFLISTSPATVSTSPISIQVPIADLVIPLDDARTAATSKSCMFGIAPSPVGLDLTSGETWILGESTLRSLYTVYDLKENRVGFAKLANGNSTNASTATANDAMTTPVSSAKSTASSSADALQQEASAASSLPQQQLSMSPASLLMILFTMMMVI